MASRHCEKYFAKRKICRQCHTAKDIYSGLFTKRKKVNEGEIPRYYVENSHPAIIEPEVFIWCKKNLKEERKANNGIVEMVYLLAGLFAASVVVFTGPRFGTAIVNTAGLFISAITSSKIKISVKRRI